MKKVFDKIICFGCGWTGSVAELLSGGICPMCKYESNIPPLWRLQTLREILDNDEETGYLDVRLDLFLKAVFHLLGVDEEAHNGKD